MDAANQNKNKELDKAKLTFHGAFHMRNEKLYEGKKNMNAVSDELMTRAQVAQLFKVSPLTVIRLEKSGKLQAIRLGAGTVRIRRSDVEKFIQASITV